VELQHSPFRLFHPHQSRYRSPFYTIVNTISEYDVRDKYSPPFYLFSFSGLLFFRFLLDRSIHSNPVCWFGLIGQYRIASYRIIQIRIPAKNTRKSNMTHNKVVLSSGRSVLDRIDQINDSRERERTLRS
jgi:hypothetical protein